MLSTRDGMNAGATGMQLGKGVATRLFGFPSQDARDAPIKGKLRKVERDALLDCELDSVPYEELLRPRARLKGAGARDGHANRG